MPIRGIIKPGRARMTSGNSSASATVDPSDATKLTEPPLGRFSMKYALGSCGGVVSLISLCTLRRRRCRCLSWLMIGAAIELRAVVGGVAVYVVACAIDVA